MRPVMYVAAPFSGDTHQNLERALRWLRWLIDREPNVAFQCSWMALASVLDDSNPSHRERAMRDCEELAHGCDGIVLVGGRISAGMEREIDACIGGGGQMFNLTSLGEDPLGIPADVLATIDEVGPINYGGARWEAP